MGALGTKDTDSQPIHLGRAGRRFAYFAFFALTLADQGEALLLDLRAGTTNVGKPRDLTT
jgi:hypothetical protein